MKRIDLLGELSRFIGEDDIVVANVGNTSHQLRQLRSSEANLYQINLGFATAVSLGLALALPHRRVVSLDGDGNILLNLSILADVAAMHPENLLLIIFDNESYDSAGGAPTATARGTDLAQVARACGIPASSSVRTIEAFRDVVKKGLAERGPRVVVAKAEMEGVPVTAESPLTLDGKENKYRFVRFIEATEKRPIMASSAGSKILLPEKQRRTEDPTAVA